VRNRERILEAAEAVFSTEGVSVPIDRVAERAGVGVGTVYRHFPTKEDLFEAIVMTRLEGLLRWPGPRRPRVSRDSAVLVPAGVCPPGLSKHDLFDAMGAAGIDFKTRCAEKLDEMKARIGLLLTASPGRGRRSGATPRSTSSSAWSLEHVSGLHTPA